MARPASVRASQESDPFAIEEPRTKTEPFTKVSYDDLVIARDLGPSAFLVYVYMKLRKGKNEDTFAGCKRMARDIGISTSTLNDALHVLKANKLIVPHVNRTRKTYSYRVATSQPGKWDRTGAWERGSQVYAKLEKPTRPKRTRSGDDTEIAAVDSDNRYGDDSKIANKVDSPEGYSGESPVLLLRSNTVARATGSATATNGSEICATPEQGEGISTGAYPDTICTLRSLPQEIVETEESARNDLYADYDPAENDSDCK